jgi:hypothetical protein
VIALKTPVFTTTGVNGLECAFPDHIYTHVELKKKKAVLPVSWYDGGTLTIPATPEAGR